MAQKTTEVFRASVPSLGMTLKVSSCIADKQVEYLKRVEEDVEQTSEDYRQVEYSANVDCALKIADGNGMRDAEFSAGGEPVKALPVFFETRYFFRADFKDGEAIKDVAVDHRMASVADAFNFDGDTLVGTLDFINEPGRFRLGLKIDFADGRTRTVWFEFMVVSVKMNVQRDYAEISKTIEAEKSNLVRAFLSKTFWGAALDSSGEADDKGWYEILVDVFDYYRDACKRIVNNPHRRYEVADEWRRADKVRRWTPGLVNRYNRMDGERRAHELFRTERLLAQTDTPENRFVLHTLRELSGKLADFAGRLEECEQISRVWIDGVRARVDELKKIAKHPFFRGVSRFDGFRQQSLVLQKSAGYAQVLASWLRLKSALTTDGNDIDVGHRPISALYEFWCFLKMRDLLKSMLGEPVDQKWQNRSPEDFLDSPELTDSYTGDDQLCKIDVTFRQGARTYLLSYQKTYSATDGAEGETMAGLNPQRPDIVLSISEGDSVFTYLFDAKYRICSKGEIDASPRAAIDDMHRYRDAILYRLHKAQVKHEIIGAYVLYPGRKAPHLCKDYDASIARENIGAIPLLPGHLE